MKPGLGSSSAPRRASSASTSAGSVISTDWCSSLNLGQRGGRPGVVGQLQEPGKPTGPVAMGARDGRSNAPLGSPAASLQRLLGLNAGWREWLTSRGCQSGWPTL